MFHDLKDSVDLQSSCELKSLLSRAILVVVSTQALINVEGPAAPTPDATPNASNPAITMMTMARRRMDPGLPFISLSPVRAWNDQARDTILVG
jgi:hypothetical protein